VAQGGTIGRASILWNHYRNSVFSARQIGVAAFNEQCRSMVSRYVGEWRQMVTRIGRWGADTLFVTHFGPHRPSDAHLADLADHLGWVSGLAKASLTQEGSDADREAWFTGEIRRQLRRRTSDADANAYEVAGRFDLNWRGLARYWRKRAN